MWWVFRGRSHMLVLGCKCTRMWFPPESFFLLKLFAILSAISTSFTTTNAHNSPRTILSRSILNTYSFTSIPTYSLVVFSDKFLITTPAHRLVGSFDVSNIHSTEHFDPVQSSTERNFPSFWDLYFCLKML